MKGERAINQNTDDDHRQLGVGSKATKKIKTARN